jgi:hypothetical protein
MSQSIHYHFSQCFNVPALKAYEWCINYDPQDHELMRVNAKREILCISDSTIVLTDVYYDKKQGIRKQKLVCLYPKQLTWTSTHLTGPNKYSQFLYQIVPENERACRLDFTGLQIQYVSKKRFNRKEIELLAEKLRSEDSAVWRLLATEMEKEFREKLF